MNPAGESGVEAPQHQPQGRGCAACLAQRLGREADLQIEGVVARAGDQRAGPLDPGPVENHRPCRIADDHGAAWIRLPMEFVVGVRVDHDHGTAPLEEISGDGRADRTEAADDDVIPQASGTQFIPQAIGRARHHEHGQE